MKILTKFFNGIDNNNEVFNNSFVVFITNFTYLFNFIV